VLAALAATVFAGAAIWEARDDAVVRWHLGTGGFGRAEIATEARRALTHVPAGVAVRATNTLLVPLLTTNTVTLIGSNVDHGDWAVLDTVDPGRPIGPAAVPATLAQLNQMGSGRCTTPGGSPCCGAPARRLFRSAAPARGAELR
jgi:hypothetical protein